MEIDVFVVGGGPAGLAAAIALRNVGMTVALADASRPPIDKACGEGLLPAALVALEQLGVPLPRTAGYRFRGIRFLAEQFEAAAYFPRGHGLGIRRTGLHRALTEYAVLAGVRMLWGTHAELLPGGELRAGGTEWRPRWIVAADGVQSRVRRAAGLDHSSDRSRRYAFRSHFAVAPWMDCVEVYWAPEGQAYVTPIGEREVCVALAVEDKNTRLAELPRIFPALAERLAGAMPTTSERGAWTICRRLPKVTCGSVVLIGDACGSVDAITGSGLALAFQQALALGEALPDGDLNLYEEKCRELSRGPHMLSRALVFLGRHPRLQNRAIQACRENGGLLADLVEAPWGAPPLWRRLPGSLARFGWNCIAA